MSTCKCAAARCGARPWRQASLRFLLSILTSEEEARSGGMAYSVCGFAFLHLFDATSPTRALPSYLSSFLSSPNRVAEVVYHYIHKNLAHQNPTPSALPPSTPDQVW